MQGYDWNIGNVVTLEFAADMIRSPVDVDAYGIKQGTAEAHTVCAVVAAAFLGGPAPGLETSDAVGQMNGVEEILAAAHGDVDGIAWAQGENTCHSGRNADGSSATVE